MEETEKPRIFTNADLGLEAGIGADNFLIPGFKDFSPEQKEKVMEIMEGVRKIEKSDRNLKFNGIRRLLQEHMPESEVKRLFKSYVDAHSLEADEAERFIKLFVEGGLMADEPEQQEEVIPTVEEKTEEHFVVPKEAIDYVKSIQGSRMSVMGLAIDLEKAESREQAIDLVNMLDDTLTSEERNEIVNRIYGYSEKPKEDAHKEEPPKQEILEQTPRQEAYRGAERLLEEFTDEKIIKKEIPLGIVPAFKAFREDIAKATSEEDVRRIIDDFVRTNITEEQAEKYRNSLLSLIDSAESKNIEEKKEDEKPKSETVSLETYGKIQKYISDLINSNNFNFEENKILSELKYGLGMAKSRDEAYKILDNARNKGNITEKQYNDLLQIISGEDVPPQEDIKPTQPEQSPRQEIYRGAERLISAINSDIEEHKLFRNRDDVRVLTELRNNLLAAESEIEARRQVNNFCITHNQPREVKEYWDSLIDESKQEELPKEESIETEEKQEKKTEPKETMPAQEQNEANIEIATARATYASELNKWKNKNRENKWNWKLEMNAKLGTLKNIAKGAKNVASDLGFEFKEPEKSEGLKMAEAVYIAAKKRKNQELFDKSETKEERVHLTTKTEVTRNYQFNQALFEQAEKEYKELQRAILEALPPREKGLAGKIFEKYAKMPRVARIALSTTLITGAGVAFGTVTLGGAAAYGGYKALRSFAGAGIAQGVGKGVEKIQNLKNKNDREEIREIYGRSIDEYNFEAKERMLMRRFEEQENTLKRQRLFKAGAMALTGVGASMAWNYADALYHGNLSGMLGKTEHFTSKDGASVTNYPNGEQLQDFGGGHTKRWLPDGRMIERIADGRTTVYETKINGPFDYRSTGKILGEAHVPPTAPVENAVPAEEIPAPAPEPISPVPEIHETSVELSSKGFIQDIENLKHKVIEQYGGEDKVPDSIKENFLNQSSPKLAIKFGFWDPEHHASGMGLKGEHLSLNEQGEVEYEDIHGAKTEIFDTNSGKVPHQFGGKMVEEHITHPTPVEPVAEPVPVAEPHLEEVEVKVPGPHLPPLSSEQAAELNTHIEHIPVGNSVVDVVTEDSGEKIVTLGNFGQIAHEQITPFGKMLRLEDAYQVGEQYKPIREAFAKAFDAEPLQGAKMLIRGDFDGGRFAVVHNINSPDKNAIDVIYNGRIIAKGAITLHGSKIDILHEPGLRGGFFRGATVYEQAVSWAKKLIEQGIKTKQITIK